MLAKGAGAEHQPFVARDYPESQRASGEERSRDPGYSARRDALRSWRIYRGEVCPSSLSKGHVFQPGSSRDNHILLNVPLRGDGSQLPELEATTGRNAFSCSGQFRMFSTVPCNDCMQFVAD